MRATYVNILKNNLRFNLESIKSLLKPDVKFCVPVKADAYGHGACEVAKVAIESGASFLAVAAVHEGIELREKGIITPILLLSLPTLEEIPELIIHSITPLVFDEDFINELGKAAKKMHRRIPVHLKVDSGMGRVGCNPNDALRIATLINNNEWLFLEGICTHFAASDSLKESDVEYTKKQIEKFTFAVNSIKESGINPGIVHCANSGAILMYPEVQFDMVRPGIIVYGYYPNIELKDELKKKGISFELKPVMELKTQIVSIKQVKKGDFISYDRTWQAPEDTYIATIPIGYADGLLRRLSPGLKVSVNGKQYPVVGRICMDQCMVNLGTSLECKRWDDVYIFGDKGVSAFDVANLLETISYEVMCGINKRVPRVYVD